MVASELLSFLNGFSVTQYSGLEDFSDRANFQGNIIVLMLSFVLISMRQYFINPIICYIPTPPGGSNAEEYITNMCWVEGTIPMNFSSKIPHSSKDWKNLEKDKMNYYQWVPFVLGIQAILYYLPRLIWQIITYNRVGLDLEQLVKDANDANSEDDETKTKIIEHIANNIEVMLYGHRKIKQSTNYLMEKVFVHLPGKRRGNLLISLYFLIKAMYIGIGFSQLFIMYNFLRLNQKEGYMLFGQRILDDIVNGKEWTETQIFPRVGMCRNPIEQLGHTNNAFAQCLLPINMLNEKIYIFLYFFLSSVLVLTICSVPLWIYRIFSRKSHKRLVKQCLRMNDIIMETNQYDKHKIDRFVVEFLRQDGNFLIRMLHMNAGDFTTSSLVCRLFQIYVTEGYYGVDLRNHRKSKECNSEEFLRIPLEQRGVALRNSNFQPSAPSEKLEFL